MLGENCTILGARVSGFDLKMQSYIEFSRSIPRGSNFAKIRKRGARGLQRFHFRDLIPPPPAQSSDRDSHPAPQEPMPIGKAVRSGCTDRASAAVLDCIASQCGGLQEACKTAGVCLCGQLGSSLVKYHGWHSPHGYTASSGSPGASGTFGRFFAAAQAGGAFQFGQSFHTVRSCVFSV